MNVNLIPFHAIDPVALQIGPVAVRWYGLAYLAGFLFAWIYLSRLMQNKQLWQPNMPPFKKDTVPDLILWGAIGVFVGGRLGYVIFYDPIYFAQFPTEIIMIHKGGMSFHGGLTGVTITTWLYARKNTINILPLLDSLALAAPIGLGLGRIANFINGELWGKPTNMPWGMIFPNADAQPRHPSQIYEAILEGALLFALLQILAQRYHLLRYPGTIAGAFAVLYAIARIIIEFFREPDAHIGYWGGLTTTGIITTGMILSLPMIMIGILLITYARRNR